MKKLVPVFWQDFGQLDKSYKAYQKPKDISSYQNPNWNIIFIAFGPLIKKNVSPIKHTKYNIEIDHKFALH